MLRAEPELDDGGRVIGTRAMYVEITERKRAEEALAYHAQLWASVSDAVISTDEQFIVRSWNPAAERMYGWKAEEVVGRPGSEVLRTDFPGAERSQAIETVVESGNFHGEVIALRDSQGRTIGYVGVNRDITERKRAEEALRRREQEINVLAQNVPALYSYVDAEGRYRFVNQRYEEWFGIPRERIIGRHVGEVLGAAAYERIKSRVEKALLGQEVRFEEEVPYRSGGTRWVSADYVPDTDDHGEVKGFFALVTDITERKQAEEARRESEEKYRRVVQDSADGIAIVKGLEFRFANAAALRMLGCRSEDEIVGQPFTDFVSPQDRKLLADRASARQNEEYSPPRYEFTALRKDGTEFPAEISVSRITYEGSVALQAIVRDITQRKRAEEALSESEERFRLIAQATSDVIWDWDLTTGHIWRSEGMQRLFGYAPSEEGPRITWWYERVHPEDRERANSGNYAAISEGGESWVNEYRFQRADGSYADVHERGYVIRDGDGKPVRLIGGISDVTERKRAEEALRESEERFKVLFESAPDAYYLQDLEGKFIDGNEVAETITGYQREELIGKNLLKVNLLPPDEIPRAAAELAERALGTASGPIEHTLIRKDGSRIAVEISTFPARFGDQALVLGIARDVTERKRAERALEESEKRYRLLAESASDIIWIRDLDLRGIYINPAVARIRGYAPDEAMVQTPEEILTPASLELAREVVAEELAKEQVEPRDLFWWRILELENICKDGSTVWLEEKVTALRDEDKRIVGILGIARDISERKRAEEALQKAREELESRVEHRMGRGNAYGLTFRELTVLHLVATGESDKEIASTLGISVLTASKHLANILHKMGATSRTEAGVRGLQEGLLDLSEDRNGNQKLASRITHTVRRLRR
jgi:PAS domain S-box-containing protein